jgi:hypothetical protein
MILLTHILIALGSIVFSAYLFLFPSRAKLYISYAFVALTLISGTALVWTMPSHALSATMSGLTYVGIMSVAIALSRRKVIKRETKVKEIVSTDSLR